MDASHQVPTAQERSEGSWQLDVMSGVSKYKTEVVDLILTQDTYMKLMKHTQNYTKRGLKWSLAIIYNCNERTMIGLI